MDELDFRVLGEDLLGRDITVRRRLGKAGVVSSAEIPFATKVAALSPALWWKLNETSGVVIANSGSLGATYNGALTLGAGALGQTGIGDGGTSILFDGTATAIANTDPVSSAQGQEGTMALWCKFAAATWLDGAARLSRIDKADNANYIRLGRATTNNSLRAEFRAGGGTVEAFNISANTTTDWFLLALTWSDVGNLLTLYQILKGGGTVVVNTEAMVNTFVGGNALWQMGFVGSFLKGNFAHWLVFPSVLNQAQLVNLAKI